MRASSAGLIATVGASRASQSERSIECSRTCCRQTRWPQTKPKRQQQLSTWRGNLERACPLTSFSTCCSLRRSRSRTFYCGQAHHCRRRPRESAARPPWALESTASSSSTFAFCGSRSRCVPCWDRRLLPCWICWLDNWMSSASLACCTCYRKTHQSSALSSSSAGMGSARAGGALAALPADSSSYSS